MKEKIAFDLHSHTTYSDGKNSPTEMIKKASEEKLDFYAITDHNTIRGIKDIDAEKILEDYGLGLITGMELSLADGHYLILGAPIHIYQHVIDKYEITEGSFGHKLPKSQVKNIFRYFLGCGAAIIVAHPCIPTGIMSTSPKDLSDFHDQELIHGAETHNFELERHLGPAYNFWHHQVDKYLKSEGINRFKNSDAHKKSDIAKRHNIYKSASSNNLVKTIIDRANN